MLIPFIIFAICVILYSPLIKFLRRYKLGQYIREEGPDLHSYKAGTPTAGGILFVLVPSLFIFFVNTADALALIFFGFIGFLDDFLSLKRKKSMGLRAWQKFLLQVIFSTVIYLIVNPQRNHILIPFTHSTLNLGYFYPIFAILFIAGFSNAVNLTDGLDGLAGGVFLTTSLPYWVFLNQSEKSLLYTSVAVMAFLIYNIKPARVFMGDTGALALGGLLATVSLRTSNELSLICFTPVFLAETFSVILQVVSFKIFKRRIFKMAPLHHHFELLGWKEERIVQMFTLVNLAITTFFMLGAPQ